MTPINANEEAQVLQRQTLRDYIQNGISKSALKDGEYEAVIANLFFVQNAEDQTKDYLRIELKLPDRILVENRFQGGYFLFERQVKEQLGMLDETLPVLELLQTLIGKTVKIWLSTVIVNGRTYQNISFAAPITETTTDIPSF